MQYNKSGTYESRLTVYCSSEAHSSVEKAVRIAGLGSNNLRKIRVDSLFRMIPAELEAQIQADRLKGYVPACIISALGTTGTCAIDPIQEIGEIAEKYKAWHHIDAAFAGTALILPEFRESVRGLELADSFVFNPHKWMFTNFDCSAFFVKDKSHLQRTFQLVPAYLQNKNENQANDYSNLGIQLGRRFRSLKLWFVIRYYGLQDLQDKVREHIRLAALFSEEIQRNKLFELIVPRSLSVVVFRCNPPANGKAFDVNVLNEKLLENINNSGEIFLSHTLAGDKFVLRFVCSQTHFEEKHLHKAIKVITTTAEKLINQLR
jgi:aromatic-L-amino-acid decarboxylase